MASRHQRRKAAKAKGSVMIRKQQLAIFLKVRDEVVRDNLSNPIKPKRSPKGMGNSQAYQGTTSPRCRGQGVTYS